MSPVIITTRIVVRGVELRSCWGIVVVGKSTVATNGVVCWGMVVGISRNYKQAVNKITIVHSGILNCVILHI